MKTKLIMGLMCLGLFLPTFATDIITQQLTPEEFKAKQRAFITERAALTKAEADKFFPLYFELQDKKRINSEKGWKLLQNGRDGKLNDAEYESIMLQIYDLRIETDQLEKVYYEKFKKILSPRKIYDVQRAEARFHRELIRNVKPGPGKPDDKPRHRNDGDRKR